MESSLKSSRLILEPVGKDYGLQLLHTTYDKALDWPAYSLRALLPFYLERLAANENEKGYGPWIVRTRRLHHVIGTVSFKGRPNNLGEMDVGYHVISRYRQQGYATEAVKSICDWGLAQEQVNSITAYCAVSNPSSHRVLLKNGFKKYKEEQDWILFRKES